MDETVLRLVWQSHEGIARFDFVLKRSNQSLRPVRTHLLIFIVKWKSLSSTLSVCRKQRQTLSEQLMSLETLLLLLCAMCTVSAYLNCTSPSHFFFTGKSTSLSVKYLAIDTSNKHILHEQQGRPADLCLRSMSYNISNFRISCLHASVTKAYERN